MRASPVAHISHFAEEILTQGPIAASVIMIIPKPPQGVFAHLQLFLLSCCVGGDATVPRSP